MLKGLKSAIKWIVAIVIICAVAVFFAGINGLNVSRTVITVNGNEVLDEEYKLYLEVVKTQLLSEQGITEEEAAKEFLKNGTIDGKAAADYIREEAVNRVIRNEIAVIKAKEAGISLTEEERNSVRETQGREETIEAYGISKKSFADTMEKSELAYKYYTHLTTEDATKFAADDADILKDINETYALVQHVLVMNSPESEEEASETYAQEAKEKAEEVLAKALEGKDFAELISEYNEDPGMESSPDGYLISKAGYTLDGQSQMVPEFTKGAFAVSAGEVNPELVESTYGWHIIKRCEITETSSDYATLKSNSEAKLKYDNFESYIDSLAGSFNIIKKDNVLYKAKVSY